jgi:hypothetical protein
MSYFDKFSKFQYNDTELQDIFRRVSFAENFINSPETFSNYVVRDGDTPEQISTIFYGTPKFWWIIMLSNNITDIHTDWVKSSSQINLLFNNFLNGNSYFIMENIEPEKGDIIVKRDTGLTGGIDEDISGVVDNYDKIFHKIDVKKSSGTLQENDEIYIFRKNNASEYELISGFGETGCYKQHFSDTSCISFTGPNDSAPQCATAGATFAKIQKKTLMKDSVVNFKYETEYISPYSSYVEGEGITGDYFSFQNLCGMTGTVLYDYMTSSLSSDIGVVTLEQDTVISNDKKKVIRILSADILPNFLSEVSLLMTGEVSPGTTTIVKYK